MTFCDATVISLIVGVGMVEAARGMSRKGPDGFRTFSGFTLWLHGAGLIVFFSSAVVLLGALAVALIKRVT